MSRLQTHFARMICLLTLAVTPLLLYGAKRAFDSNSNNVVDWLPQNFEETQRLFRFVERFGSDEILALGWEGCTLDDPRVDRLAERLIAPVTHERFGPGHRWFRAIYTGRQTLADLTEREPHLTREEAIDRMTGWLIGRDRHTTCVVGMISDAGQQDRHGAVAFVRKAAAEIGIPSGGLYIAGPTADSVAVDRASSEGIFELGLISAAVGMGIAWISLRNGRLVVLLLITATTAWGLSLSCLVLSGSRMDAVLLVMPGLVFMLAVSGGMHLTHYYLEESAGGKRDDAPLRAVRRAWLPTTLAMLTTIVGLISLGTSQLLPIRRFGLFASLGVLFDLLCLLVLWPSFAHWWPPRAAGQPHSSTAPDKAWWRPLYSLTGRHGQLVLLSMVLALPACGLGLTRLRSSVQLQDLFRPGAEILTSCAWLERHLGALVPVEIVLSFPCSDEDRDSGMLKRAIVVEKLRQAIAGTPGFDSALAATTFAPSLPTGADEGRIVQRRLLAKRLPEYRDRFAELRMLYDEPQQQLWRISARVSSTHADYGKLLAELRTQLDSFVERESQDGMEVAAEVCGAVPLIYLAQERLLQDLIVSYLVAFGLIWLMMVVLVRSCSAAALAMIPNVMPALASFGLMGILDWPVDIGTMMTASVAMGVAVDNTVHFLVAFQRGIREGHSRPDAIRFAFSRCAGPMLQSTAMCGLALLVFVFSPFGPVARFGGVMAFMLAVGLFGDLVVLPSLLFSRAGHVFLPRRAHTLDPLGASGPVGALEQ